MTTNGNFDGLTSAQVVGTLKANDSVPVTLAEQVRGSLRTVQSLTDRDAIPGRKLDNGMLVYVTDANTHYVYIGGTRSTSTGIMTGGSFSVFTGGSGGSGAGLRLFSVSSDYDSGDIVIFDGGFFSANNDIIIDGTCTVVTTTTAADCTTAGGTFDSGAGTCSVDSTTTVSVCEIGGGTFAPGTNANNPETTGQTDWTRIVLDLVENWDGVSLTNLDGSVLDDMSTPTLINAQVQARTALGGNAITSVAGVGGIDGFLSKIDKEKVDDLPSTWISGTTYAKDQIVSFGERLYRSLAESNTTVEPNNPCCR